MSHESTVELPNSPHTGNADWVRPLEAMATTANVVALTRKARIDGSPRTDIVRRKGVARADPGEVLAKDHFLRQLEREKRRADRFKASLSIAVFDLDSRSTGENDAMAQLVGVLCADKRETDILGCLTGESVAVLLPDTDELGTQRFTAKIVDHADDLHLATITKTYPDQLFDRLAGEDKEVSAGSFVIDDHCGPGGIGYLAKRIIDFIGAAIGLLLVSPLMLATAIAIALNSPGAVIYKQIRLGRGGQPFVFYKFRSMYSNVDDRIHREYVTALIAEGRDAGQHGGAARPWTKLETDPRITSVGRFIRRTCIDELPQLFNVLKGDLSLVGPRPPLPYEVAAYESWHLRRIFEVQPGVTGLWQVEGRNAATFDDMVRMDLRYMRDRSLMLDFKILVKTVLQVLRS